MTKVSKYISPAKKRMITRQRKGSRKNKKQKKEDRPSWVKALQTKYNGEKKGDEKFSAKRRKRPDSGNDAEGGEDRDDDDGLEVESEVDEEKIESLNKDTPLDTQLFIRGLPSDADEASLKSFFAQYGNVKRVFFVQNKITKRSSGSAFIHFDDDKGAEKAFNSGLHNANEATSDVRHEDEKATEGMTHTQAKRLLYKIKQDRFTSKDPFVTFMNTRVTVMRPLDRSEAQEMTSGGKNKKEKRTVTGSEDPRNLYLLEEGVIFPGTRAAEDLNPKFLESLLRDYETRKQQLRNVNLFVSKTRLSIRNLPRSVSDKDLRTLFLGQVRDLIKQNPKLKHDKQGWGKHGPIKQLRILVDRAGTSRGYGFVEFVKHEFALHVLRHSNNNPTLFGPNHRLVVAFAVENINAIQKMERLKELRKEKMAQAKRSGFVDRPEDDVDPVIQAALKEEQIKKKKEMSKKKMNDAAAPYVDENDDDDVDGADDDNDNNDDDDGELAMKKPSNSADAASKKPEKKKPTATSGSSSSTILATARPGVLLTAEQQAAEKAKIEKDKLGQKSKAQKVAADRKRKFILQSRKKGKKG